MKIEKLTDYAVVSGIASFDHETAALFAAEVTLRVDEQLPRNIIVDLSATTGVYSAAFVELVGLEDVTRNKGGFCWFSADYRLEPRQP